MYGLLKNTEGAIKKRTIQRNWQNRVHKTKKNKTKTQHKMCRTQVHTNKMCRTQVHTNKHKQDSKKGFKIPKR